MPPRPLHPPHRPALLAIIGFIPMGTMATAADALGVQVSFTVVTRPVITSATTLDSDGDGRVDRLALTFSVPVDVIDGAGSSDGFPALSLSGGRVIAPADHAATAITAMTIAIIPGAGADGDAVIAPTYRRGFPSRIISTASGLEIADLATVPGTDGSAPVVSGVLPASASTVGHARLTYTLSEAAASGTVTWTRSAGAADPVVHAQTLVGGELAAGLHDDITLVNAPILVPGAAYDLSFVVTDAAGNTRSAVASTGVIFQPTPGGLPTLTIADAIVPEGDAGTVDAVFTVTLSATSSQAVSVGYASADGSATAARDYTASGPATLVIPAGALSGFIPVMVQGNRAPQPTRTFVVTLSFPVNATIARGIAIGTIIDDDGPPVGGGMVGASPGGAGRCGGGGLVAVAMLLMAMALRRHSSRP